MAFSAAWHHLLLLWIYSVIWVVSDLPCCSSSSAHDKNKCSEQCGSLAIPYPFHLSRQCGLPGFKLECMNSSTLVVRLDNVKYTILSFSSDSIVIDPLGSTCELSVKSFRFRGNKYYGISLENFLQLSDCRNSSACLVNCNIPIKRNNAECKYNATCCYPLANATLWQVGDSISNFSRFHCNAFSSWVLSSPSAHTVNAEYGLKMEWAVPGSCSNVSCSPNAQCVEANTIKDGVRCQCKHGFEGDGFADGVGCLKACLTKDGRTSYEKDCNSARSVINVAVLAAGIVGTATILAGFIVSFALLRRYKYSSLEIKRRGDPSQLASLLSIHGKACTTKLLTYKELEKATKGFAPSEKLGNGACGTVYAGKLPNGCLVAVKRIHYGSTQGTQQLINEVNVLSTVRHRNLVRLLGCCIEMASPLLVYEFVPNGTLAEHLQHERGEGLNWLTRITVATETAKAIAYLHSTVNPPIYHRDVKSTNILLDYDYTAKVADFGLSRLGLPEGSHISTTPQGTPGYLDPEYHQNFHLSDKSDVYSFGVVLIELITAMKPVDFSRDKKEVNLAALALAKIGNNCLDDIIDPFLQVQKQPLLRALVQRVAEVAFRCLSYDKDARPTMLEVTEELLLIKKDSMNIRIPSPQENCEVSLENLILQKANMSPNSTHAPWTSNDSSMTASTPSTSG
ncbi:wall-associated receptor kinase-like 14 [Cryptomeria japonica]|uniref:wall-associated receptor kinase-like 14 n=1 Tax=Cryptomeria japonica TaxID=3369 RepID=UPI0027D9F4C5|nr:wall-associated receptor kinase-like 14 [Cryptomeria japonica]